VADHHAWDSALRPKKCLLAVNRKLRNIVASKILDWSPEQISGWLKMHYADDQSMRVSHETVHRRLFIPPSRKLSRAQRPCLFAPSPAFAIWLALPPSGFALN
jgi:IS30 family transposase